MNRVAEQLRGIRVTRYATKGKRKLFTSVHKYEIVPADLITGSVHIVSRDSAVTNNCTPDETFVYLFSSFEATGGCEN